MAGGAAAPTDWKTKILTDYDRYGYDFALQMVVVNFGLPKEVVDQMVNEYSDKRKGLEAFLTEWLGL